MGAPTRGIPVGDAAEVVIGSVVDPGGVPRAKTVPARHAGRFAAEGMGAAVSWSVFCADDQLAFTPEFSVVGDLRLRLAADGLRDLGEGLAWGPCTVVAQDGSPAPVCTRSALSRVVADLARDGLSARVGHEVEFTVFGGPPRPWSAYGLGAVLDRADVLRDILHRADRAGLDVLQLHAEYGPDQFELSLAPSDPVTAADEVILARTVVSQAARAAGLAASFSPLPTAEGAGNGAHQHLSLRRRRAPVLAGGRGPFGLTATGSAAIAGILRDLPDLGAVLTGSVLSGHRLRPGMWSGAWVCWGPENREAAVRLCRHEQRDPDAVSIEIKAVDASANPYLATALLLAAAHRGIRESLIAPEPVTADPPGSGAARLPDTGSEQLSRLAGSERVRSVLGAPLVTAIAAVRSREHATWDGEPVAARADRFRFSWTP